MHRKEQKEDADQPVLLVKTTREEAENLRKERLERLVEKKIRDFTVGLRGEDNMTWKNVLCKSGQCTRATKKTSSTSKGKKWMKCVSDGKGGHKRVHWGQKGVTVSGKRKGKRRKSFRARHKCSSCKGGDNSPRCMACRDW